MEMVLKSIMSARSPLNTTVEKGSTCVLKYTDPPTKWAMFERQSVWQPRLSSYKQFFFLSLRCALNSSSYSAQARGINHTSLRAHLSRIVADDPSFE